MANVPEMKRSWTASTFDKDKRAKDAERAVKYRRFQEDRNTLRRASRVAYLRGIRENNPQMLMLSQTLREKNTAMGGDNRSVESIRQRLLLEEAQRGANTTDIYNALQKAMPPRRTEAPAPTAVVTDSGDKSKKRQQPYGVYNQYEAGVPSYDPFYNSSQTSVLKSMRDKFNI